MLSMEEKPTPTISFNLNEFLTSISFALDFINEIDPKFRNFYNYVLRNIS